MSKSFKDSDAPCGCVFLFALVSIVILTLAIWKALELSGIL